MTTGVHEHGHLSAPVINNKWLLFIDHLACDAVNPPNSLTVFFWWQREKLRLPETDSQRLSQGPWELSAGPESTLGGKETAESKPA